MTPLHPDAVSAYRELHGELRHYAGVRNREALRLAFPWLFRNATEVLVACGIPHRGIAQLLHVDIIHFKDWMRGHDLPVAKEQNLILGVLAKKIGELLPALQA